MYLVYVLLVFGSVLGSHVPPGCLPYKYKKNLYSTNGSIKDAARGSMPEWCTNPQLTSVGMERKTKGERNNSPFIIHTFNYTNSNAIRVKIRGRKGGDIHPEETKIQECIVQARSGDGKVIGKFYPWPPDATLNCCKNILDLNTARISRLDSTVQNSSVNFLWIPSGFLVDFQGPFKFIVSILNGQGTYWPSLESQTQYARKSVKLEASAETQPPEIP